MSDKSVTGDDQLDWTLIRLAVVQSDFDLDKAAQQLQAAKFPGGKPRIVDVLAKWEAHIANVERTTRDPETRLAMRALLANIRKTRHPR